MRPAARSGVIDMASIKPLDREAIIEAADRSKTGRS
jgi:transketolase